MALGGLARTLFVKVFRHVHSVGESARLAVQIVARILTLFRF